MLAPPLFTVGWFAKREISVLAVQSIGPVWKNWHRARGSVKFLKGKGKYPYIVNRLNDWLERKEHTRNIF